MVARIKTDIKVSIPGLANASPYLAFELNRAGNKLGDNYVTSIRKKQRKDTGRERAATNYRIKKFKRGLDIRVEIFNNTIQAAVDETGAIPHFPPFRKGSRLYAWVSRKGIAATRSAKELNTRASATRRKVTQSGGDAEARSYAGRARRAKDTRTNERRIEGVAFAIARAISRRGLPRPGDPLRSPFGATHREKKDLPQSVFNYAVLLAVKKINDEKAKGAR